MGRVYTVSYTGTVTLAGGNSDLLEVLPVANKPVRLRGLLLSQISEVGDLQEEGLQMSLLRMTATVTSGSGGSTVTPQPAEDVDIAAGFTAECNNATVATTSGTTTTLAVIGWNNRNSPYEMWFPDKDFAPLARQGSALLVRMDTTPADDFTACLTFWLEEE